MLREADFEEQVRTSEHGIVPTGYATTGPRTIPRVDYERIFVLDDRGDFLGEYVLKDDCPVEYADLHRSIPINGLRHLVSFYQGEFAFTPFRVDDLWFVTLTRGIPRLEDRGSIGTLLAAARIHIVPNLAPALAKRESLLHERERSFVEWETHLSHREQRTIQVEAELQVATMRLREVEADIKTREGKLLALRDYAIRMQRSFREAARQDSTMSGGSNPPTLPAPMD